MVTIANPYVNLNLRIPEHEWDAVRRFTTTFRSEGGGKPDIDRSPFDRYVDLWWNALCIGVREDRRTVPPKWHDFITGSVLNSDPWRIRHLELVALAEEGAGVLEDPGKVIGIANEYAATGMGKLIDTMTGRYEPIWDLTSFLRSLVEEAQPGSISS